MKKILFVIIIAVMLSGIIVPNRIAGSFGAVVSAAGSTEGINTDLSKSDSSQMQAISLVESSNSKNAAGKIEVTGKVINRSMSSKVGGIVAIGYDSNNKPVETKCESDLIMPKGSTKYYKVVLNAGYTIERVEVRPAGNFASIKLLSQGDRLENGKVLVTGCVENGTSKGEPIGIVAIGYDLNNKPVETKCISDLAMPGYSKSFSVVLDAGSQIKRVEVKEIGKATDITLLSGAYRLENGKMTVTGCVENGTVKGEPIGIVATGYDLNNKPIETKCISDLAMPGYSKSFSVVLDAGSQIKRVEVKEMGKATDITLLSGAYRLENEKMTVTGSVENGTSKGEPIGIIVIGYDIKNNPVETKCISDLAMPGYCKSFNVALDSGSIVKRVDVKATGKATDVTILSGAARVDGGKVIATGSIENGASSSINATVTFTAYDKNNKQIEEKKQYVYISSGYCSLAAATLHSTQINYIIVKTDKGKGQFKITLNQ